MVLVVKPIGRGQGLLTIVTEAYAILNLPCKISTCGNTAESGISVVQ